MASLIPAHDRTARATLLRRRLAQTTAFAGLLIAAPVAAQSLPAETDANVTAGLADVTRSGNTLEVALRTPNTVIDWKKFDIGTGQTANFSDARTVTVVPSIQVLNRVTGPNGDFTGVTQSQILGSLTSGPNVTVYLMNPQGILFGGNSSVSVGSLIATTLQTDPLSFGLAGTGLSRQFAGASTESIQVLDGATITTFPSPVDGTSGRVALIAAAIDSRGSLNASGELALVAAQNVTLNFDPASPLRMTVVQGSPLSNPVLIRGGLTGSSILLVAASTQRAVVDSVLDVQATLSATSALATDQGIVLVAGPTVTPDPAVTFQTGRGTDSVGLVSATLGGTMTASDVNGRISVRSSNGIAAGATPANFQASQALLVRADTGGATFGNGTGSSATVSVGSGAINAGTIRATGGVASVIAPTGSVTLTGLSASGAANASGTSLSIDTVGSDTATLDLTATATGLSIGTATSAGETVLTAVTDIAINSATTTGATADLTLAGVGVGGRIAGSRAALSAGRDLIVNASGTVLLGAATGNRDATIGGTTVNATSATATTRALAVTASSGDLTLGGGGAGTSATLRAPGTLSVTGTLTTTGAFDARAGIVSLATVNGGTSLIARSDVGAVSITAGNSPAIDINAATTATIGTLDGATINAFATTDLTATRMSATGTLSATGATLSVGTAGAGTGNATLTALNGAASVANFTAGQDATLSATARATLSGTATAGRDLIVSGTEVRLGNGAAVEQGAGRTASYTAISGSIVGQSGLVLRADTAGAATGALILDASTDIALGGTTIRTGDPLGTARTGDVGIRLGSASAPLVLGVVDARALLSVDAAHTGFTPFATSGAVTLGATTLERSLALSTPGTISLAGITITGPGEQLSVAGTGFGTTVTSTGTLSAQAGVTVSAINTIQLADVAAGGGTALLQSSLSTLSAGAVSGATVNASALGGVTLASVNATAGGATLRSSFAGLTVTGATTARDALSARASTAVSLGDVRSTAGLATITSDTATVTTGAARAGTDLRVDAVTGATLGSATADAGTVMLTVTGGPLTVTNATTGQGDVTLRSSGIATLGAVTSLGGLVSITSDLATVGAGAVRANGALTVAAATGATLASATSDASTVTLGTTTGGLTVTGSTTGQGLVSLSAPGAVALGGVTSTADAVTIRSTGATVNAGAVRASGALTVSAVTGTTLGSAASDASTVALGTTGGTLTVTGATTGAGLVDLNAPTVLVGDVTSTGGAVTIASTLTSLTAGAVRANGALTVGAATGVTLASAASDTSTVTAGTTTGGLTVTGLTTGNGLVDLRAPGAIQLGDVRSTAGGVTIASTAASVNAGAVRASGALGVSALTGATLASATSDASSIALGVTGGPLTVTGATLGSGLVDLRATGAVSLGDVRSTGGAVVIDSSTATVDAGAVRANAALTVTAATGATLGSATSDLSTVTLSPVAGTLTVNGATTASGLIDLRAPGLVSLGDVTSTTGAVLIGSSGAGVTAGAVRASTDVTVAGATGVTLGSVTSDAGTIGLSSTSGGVTVTGVTLAAGDIGVDAPAALALGNVTSTGGVVTLTSTGAGVSAGSVTANGALLVSAATDLALGTAASDLSSVTLTATGGTLTVTGSTAAQGVVQAQALGAVTLGDVTSRAAGIALGSDSATVTAGALLASGAIGVNGPTGVTLGSARSTGGSVTIAAPTGAVTVTGLTRGQGLVQVTGRDRVSLADATSDLGGITLASSDNSVSAGILTAAGLIDVNGSTGVTVASAISSAQGIALRAPAGGITATGTLRAATDVLVDGRDSLSLAAIEAPAGNVTLRSSAGSISGTTVSALLIADIDAALNVTLPSAGVGTLMVNARGGFAQVGTITTSGNASVTASGNAAITGVVFSGGDLTVRGGTVTLGDVGGAAVEQAATGAIALASTGGAITGRTGLTLRSDRSGAGSRDLTLQSTGGIVFQPGTLLAGGSDRQSSLRLAAASGAAITLDNVEARTIASPGVATVFTHDGALSITRAATRDGLAITLAGATPLALTLGTAEVRGGDMALTTNGALATGALTAPAGTIALDAGTIASGALSGRGITAVTRVGGATFQTLDATQGQISVTSATDLRLMRADATGAVTLTSTNGDVTGLALPGGGYGQLMLSSRDAAVTVAANSVDGTHGVLRLGTVSGASGIDLSGRTISANALNASAGGVRASTRRDAAGITDLALTVSTIDAAGAITLTTGNALVSTATAPIALDRATSTGGSIAITTLGGGLSALDPALRTVLAAPGGSITLDIGGTAVLGSVTARDGITGTADALQVGTASSGGALALTARTGTLRVDTGTSGAGATLSAPVLSIGTLDTVGAATLTGTTVLTADRLGIGTTLGADSNGDITVTELRTGGNARLTSGQQLRLATVVTPAMLTLAGAGVSVATSDVGALSVTAGASGANLVTTTVAGAATIGSSAGITLGTLTAGNASLTAAGALTADLIAVQTGLSVSAASVRITRSTVAGGLTRIQTGSEGLDLGEFTTGGDLELETGGALAAASLDVTGNLTASGASAILTALRTGGDANLTARAGNLGLGTAAIGRAAALGASGTITANDLVVSTTLTANGGGVVTITRLQAGGDASVTSGQRLQLGTVSTPALLTLDARSVQVTEADLGALAVTAGTGGADLQTATVTGPAMVTATGGLALGTLAAGSAELSAGGALTADLIAASTGIVVSADSVEITRATTTSGQTRISAAAAGLELGDVIAGGDVLLSTTGTLAASDLDVAGSLDATAASASLTRFRTGRDAALVATGGDLGIGNGAAGGMAALEAPGRIAADTLTVGTTLTANGGGDVAIATLQAGGNTLLASGRQLRLVTVTTPGSLTLDGVGITIGQADVGVLAVTAGADGADLQTTNVAGRATIGSASGITLGSLTADSAEFTAVGSLSADLIAVRTGLSISAGSVRIARSTVTAGATRIATGSEGLTLGDFVTGGALELLTDGVLSGANLDVGGSLTATAASATLTALRTGSSADLTARAGGLRFGTARIGGAATLVAPGAISADALTVAGALTGTGGSIALIQSDVGGSVALTARTGDIALGTARFRTDATLAAAVGAISADSLTVGTRLTANGRTLRLRDTGVGTDATLGADTATLGALRTGGILTLATTGATTADLLAAGGASRITAGALTATRVEAGGAIDVRAGSAAIGDAAARGGDLVLAATAGDLRLGTGTTSGAATLASTGGTAVTGAVTAATGYRIDAASIALGTDGATARQAARDATLTARTGRITLAGSTTLATNGDLVLAANGTSGGVAAAPESTITSAAGSVSIATTGTAALGSVGAAAGDVRLSAADATLTRTVSARTITVSNISPDNITRLGDAAVGNEAEFGATTARFDLASAEVAFLSAPRVTIASGTRNVVVGALPLAAATGSTSFAIRTSGRIDMLGRFVATGGADRTVSIGGDGASGRSSVIRIAATPAAGGRVLVDGAVLELSADRIGAGFDRDFLTSIGYNTATGLGVDQVTREYVARPTSTLYNASALGAPRYSDGVLVQSGTMRLDYTRYALFQNTGLPGEQRGIVLNGTGPGATLQLTTSGDTNAFAYFGTINGISSTATALLGPDRISVGEGVSPLASRINGCIIGSGGGCLNTSIAQPTLNVFDTSRAEIVRTADDLSLPFDPLIGTNNEALYLDIGVGLTPDPEQCEGDKPCPTKP